MEEAKKRKKWRIGFAGLGKMGGGIARRLADCGHDVTVFDQNPAAMEPFGGTCRLAASMEELAAGGEILCVSLPGTPEVDSAVDAFLRAGAAGRIFIDMSTSFPTATIRNSQRVAEAGGQFLEAPLTGGPAQAPTGDLGMLAAGDQETYRLLQPLLEQVASRLTYAGGVGCGHTLKLALNYLTISYIALYAEIMPMLSSMGVPYEVFYGAVTGGAADCGMFQRIAPKIGFDDYTVTFLMRHAQKDLRYAKHLYEEKGYPSLMLDACVNLFSMAGRMGLENKDVAEVAQVTKFFMDHKNPGCDNNDRPKETEETV